jgi:putative adenylate-forming enzyme
MRSALLPVQVLLKRWALERNCGLTRQGLLELQARRVAELRRFALERSPFYRKFHRGMEGRPLAALPVLTKAKLMENFDELVTDRSVRLADAEGHLRRGNEGLLHGRYVALSTSGSTGLRGVFLFSRREWITVLSSIGRPALWAGATTPFGKLPRLAMMASRTPWHYSAKVMESVANRFAPSLGLDAAEPLDSLTHQLNEWRPEALGGYPSVLRQLADEQIAGRLRIQPRAVVAAAEVLTVETRRRLREAWGAPVFDTYGATEYSPIAAECAYGRKHLFEDGAVIEVVDEAGRAVPPGETGERILITVFDRRTQPLIRYEISDRVRPLSGECECGRKFTMIEAVEGRLEDVLVFPGRDGGAKWQAHPNVFHEALETLPVAGWQVIHEPGALSVLLVGLRDSAVLEPLRRAIAEVIERNGAAAPEIRVLPVERLERGATGKAPLIVSRVGSKACGASGG